MAGGRENAFAIVGLVVAVTGCLIWLPWPAALVGFGLAALMAAIGASDARTLLIPDVLSLPSIPIGLIAAAWLAQPGQIGSDVANHLFGAALGFALTFGLQHGYRRLRGREGLGRGDVKLAAAGGAWTGAPGILHVLLVASLVALAVALAQAALSQKRLQAQSVIAFGVYLAIAIWLVWFFQRVLEVSAA